ncbi:MAG: AAA family ATPase [Clostridiales bacterium]|nr:AAA family ATPase [Clostridiales bacterium]
MIDKYKVPVEQLKVTYNMSKAGFKTTDDIEPLKGIIGQDRAIRALEFGLQTNRRGYHIYVSGQSGTGRNSFVHHLTSEKASNRDVPKDWIYVYNFNDSNKPLAIGLNAGDGKAFKEEIEHMISGIRKDIENAFESKDYESMKNALFKQYDDESKNLIQELNKIAEKFDFRFFQTDKGLMSTPLKDGEPMKEEEYRSLSKEDYENLREKSNSLGLETVDIFNEIKDLEEEYQKRFKNLDNEFGAKIIDIYIEKIKNKFSYCTKAVEYCSMLREDIIEHISNFKKGDEDRNNPLAILQITSSPEAFFKWYNVNLFVDNSSRTCAPLIIENHPTYKNLLGSIDYKMEMGIARTDFTYIKSGSLHQANGGYIILQVSEILSNTFAWEGLMRALITSEICIEGVESQYGFASPLALKPEPIPLDVKVILIGNPYIYSLLLNYDKNLKSSLK